MAAKHSETSVPLTPDKLGEIYPTPKTFEEREQESEDREELFKARRTRMPAFKIALFGTLLVAAAAIYANLAGILWTVRDVTVSTIGYAVWAVLILFAIKWIRYTSNIFYQYSSPVLAFWVSYIAVMGLTVFAWQKGMWLASNDPYWIAILSGAQFVVTYIAAKLLIKR